MFLISTALELSNTDNIQTLALDAMGLLVLPTRDLLCKTARNILGRKLKNKEETVEQAQYL